MTTVLSKISRTVISAVVISVAAGCTRQSPRGYSEFVTLPQYGWVYGDTLRIVTQMADSTVSGPLLIHTCHDDDYVYANLWIEATYCPSDTTRATQRDTINIQLANHYGQWMGRGFGTTFQTTDTLATQMTLSRGDTLLLRHIMRVDTIGHITQVGLSLDNTNR